MDFHIYLEACFFRENIDTSLLSRHVVISWHLLFSIWFLSPTSVSHWCLYVSCSGFFFFLSRKSGTGKRLGFLKLSIFLKLCVHFTELLNKRLWNTLPTIFLVKNESYTKQDQCLSFPFPFLIQYKLSSSLFLRPLLHITFSNESGLGNVVSQLTYYSHTNSYG